MNPDLTYSSLSPTKQKILQMLVEMSEGADWEVETLERPVKEFNNNIDRSREYLTTTLNDMVDEGILKKRADGRKRLYSIAPDFTDLAHRLTLRQLFVDQLKENNVEKTDYRNSFGDQDAEGYTMMCAGLPTNDGIFEEKITINGEEQSLESLLNEVISKMSEIKFQRIKDELESDFDDLLDKLDQEKRSTLQTYREDIIAHYIAYLKRPGGLLVPTRDTKESSDIIAQFKLVDNELYDFLVENKEVIEPELESIHQHLQEIEDDDLSLHIKEGRFNASTRMEGPE
jgi:hypothetical protein